MSTYTTDKASSFTRAVVNSMRKLYPEALADKSFDNTGLLLEAPFNPLRRQKNSVLLTIDLTKAVADEAIERRDSIVIAYHPIIFKGLKALTLADTQQQSLLRLAQEGISVYCPHTAIDAAPGGLGDWLADIVTGALSGPESGTEPPEGILLDTDSSDDKLIDSDDDPFIDNDTEKQTPKQRFPRIPLTRTYSEPKYPKPRDSAPTHSDPSPADHTRSIIQPIPPIEGLPPAGIGRLITFAQPRPLTHLINLIAHSLGNPAGFPVAIPQTAHIEQIHIRTVAICAGSGASILRQTTADLLFTGELAHHEALAVTERGACVLSLGHSNTERGFLGAVLRGQLLDSVEREWERVRADAREERGGGEEREKVEEREEKWTEALGDSGIAVDVSERDRDPYGIVILQAGALARGKRQPRDERVGGPALREGSSGVLVRYSLGVVGVSGVLFVVYVLERVVERWGGGRSLYS